MQMLLSAIYRHAQAAPYRPAVLIGSRATWKQFSYRDLIVETERWARLFSARLLPAGSTVFIVLDHRWEMYPAFLGAMRLGLIPSFLSYPTPKQDPVLYWSTHAALFERVRPAAVLSYGALLPDLGALVKDADCCMIDVDALAEEDPSGELPPLESVEQPAAVALLQHSSGTTGLKKGVVITYEQILRQFQSYGRAIATTADDVTISWLPVYHDMGLMAAFLLPLATGGRIVSIDAFEWLVRPALLLDLIEQYRCTICWLPNFTFNHLVRTRDPERIYDLSSMRAFINCSEPCKPVTMEIFAQTFASHGLRSTVLQASYGMAEVVFAATQTDPQALPRFLYVDGAALAERRMAVPVRPSHPRALGFMSCGRAIDDIEIHIGSPMAESRAADDQDGAPVDELYVSGGYLFSGYHRNPSATEQVLSGGWYKTGDIGFIHENEIYICGRTKELLIVHGRNYYANDIEAAVNTVEGVKPGRVVAVGVFDETTASEEAVVLAEALTEDETARTEMKKLVRKAVLDALGLMVKHVELWPDGTLVKTTSGKISREENLKRYMKNFVETVPA